MGKEYNTCESCGAVEVESYAPDVQWRDKAVVEKLLKSLTLVFYRPKLPVIYHCQKCGKAWVELRPYNMFKEEGE